MKSIIKGFSQFLNEDAQPMAAANTSWDAIYKGLSGFNSPKIIKWNDNGTPNVSLNWMSPGPKGIDVVLAVKNYDTRVAVVGSQAEAIKSELKSAGFKIDQYGDADYAGIDAAKVVAAMQSVIKNHKLQ